MNPTCETCRWWMGVGNAGDCRRLSPLMADGTAAGKKWPPTWADNWCGEHQPREVAVEKPKVREPDIYWVKTPLAEWRPALWRGDGWLLIGNSNLFREADTVDWRIDERPMHRSPA